MRVLFQFLVAVVMLYAGGALIGAMLWLGLITPLPQDAPFLSAACIVTMALLFYGVCFCFIIGLGIIFIESNRAVDDWNGLMRRWRARRDLKP
jgi:hypothetical protein